MLISLSYKARRSNCINFIQKDLASESVMKFLSIKKYYYQSVFTYIIFEPSLFFFFLFEITKLLWIIEPLQKPIHISDMSHFCIPVLYSTVHYVRNRILYVKFPAKFFV